MQRIQQFLRSPEPIKWIFDGDSITHGALHTVGWRDYTEHFTERLRYEMGRMRDVVRAHARKTAHEIAHAVDEALIRFGEDCDFRDDVTFVIIKVLGVGAAAEETARGRSPASTANRGGPAAPALRI